MFNHNPIDLPTLERKPVGGVRYYKVPDGDEWATLVSVTSVISHWKADVFKEWRQRVGEEEANRITRKATSRGTDMHSLVENYLKNSDEEIDVLPISNILFNIAKPELNKIDNIIVQESPMYSLKLGVAGTPDCIAEYNGELSVIDFKTSKAPKPREWVEGYFVQASAYACMLYELTGLQVKNLVIIMACEDGDCVVYEDRDILKYVKLLTQYIRKFLNDKIKDYE